MGFYDLPKQERDKLVLKIHNALLKDIKNRTLTYWTLYFSNEDTYIRKTAYLSIGKIVNANPDLSSIVLYQLESLFKNSDFKIRQTVINAAGELGKLNFEIVEKYFDKGLFDVHHAVRNAVIGSMKKMGQKNPLPILNFAKKYLHHPDAEIRREICHGIELRGRTHPEDILPLLKKLQFDTKARVRKTLIHVLGQISYKNGCLEKVIAELNTWKNRELVCMAVEEILDVHIRYKNFSAQSHKEAKSYVKKHFIK
jgi:HEAT repeat protein